MKTPIWKELIFSASEEAIKVATDYDENEGTISIGDEEDETFFWMNADETENMIDALTQCLFDLKKYEGITKE